MNSASLLQIFEMPLFKNRGKIARNPHLWIIFFITLVLVFIYQGWPWRFWIFTEGIWKWFPWLSALYNLALVEVMYHVVGLLFLIPILYAVLVLPWQGSLLVSLVSSATVLSMIMNIWTTNIIISNTLVFMLPFLVFSVVNFERRWRIRERRIFTERETERQVYISQILDSQEKERRHVAQELHDDTIQTLLVIANRTQSLITSANNGDIVGKNAEWIRDTTLQAVEDLRRISLDLTPSVLEDLGLIPALRWLVERTNNESNITTSLNTTGTERKLAPKAEVAVFRIVQEALTNIKRHSRAGTAVVNLEFSPEFLSIIIKDDGQGFSPPKRFHGLATSGKLGLAGIQERVNFLNGDFRISSSPGRGTSLFIEVKC